MKVTDRLKHLVPKDTVANLRWRAQAHRLVLADPSLAEVFRDACSHDPVFFCNGFVFTQDTRREPFSKLPFILYDYQEEMLLEVIRAMNDHDLLIEKSRDMGASWVNLVAILWCWLCKSRRDLLVGSRNEEYVDKPGNPKALLYRFDFMLDSLPIWLQPKGYTKSQHRSKNHIENPETGCVLDGESTTENFASGDRRTIVLLDEFSKVKNGHQILASTQPVTKCRLFNSTPYGINNAFYELVQKPTLKKLRLHWSQHPLKAEGLYKKENGQYVAIDTTYWDKIENPEQEMERYDQMIIGRGVPLPDNKVRSPWYALECERALSAAIVAQELDIDYLGSGGQFFDPNDVQEIIRKYARTPLLVGDLEYDYQMGDPIRFRENSNGRLRCWFLLNKLGKPAIDHRSTLGCDISSGTGASNSAACGWDDLTCEKLCEYADPHIKPEPFGVFSVALAKWLGDARIIWEANGPGRNFGDKVTKELSYGNIYLREKDQSITGKVSDIPGVAATPAAKLSILGRYREAIETGECINKSKEAMEETLEYIYTPDGGVEHSRALNKADPSGAKKNHGDRAMADALAWKGLTFSKHGLSKEEPKIPYGSLAWRNKQREKKNRRSNNELSEAWSR